MLINNFIHKQVTEINESSLEEAKAVTMLGKWATSGWVLSKRLCHQQAFLQQALAPVVKRELNDDESRILFDHVAAATSEHEVNINIALLTAEMNRIDKMRELNRLGYSKDSHRMAARSWLPLKEERTEPTKLQFNVRAIPRPSPAATEAHARAHLKQLL